MLNNPSNPCGSNWREAHLRDIAAVMEKHRVLVVSDEGVFLLFFLRNCCDKKS
jgi:bifunctional pyridoxal-dependent enzyme with beta-cystathionase and maltose regulon repressor activities